MPELLSKVDGYETWEVDRRIRAILPTIQDQWPADLKEAVSRRRAVILEGSCPCGAAMRFEATQLVTEHEPDCIAPDAPDILARWLESTKEEEV